MGRRPKSASRGSRSMGASPGPACYSKGGIYPTVTDANLVLGYLNKDFFLGGRLVLDEKASANALQEHVANRFGLGLEESAWAIYKLANVNMAGAVREVSVNVGQYRRDFTLIASGGGGPGCRRRNNERVWSFQKP